MILKFISLFVLIQIFFLINLNKLTYVNFYRLIRNLKKIIFNYFRFLIVVNIRANTPQEAPPIPIKKNNLSTVIEANTIPTRPDEIAVVPTTPKCTKEKNRP